MGKIILMKKPTTLVTFLTAFTLALSAINIPIKYDPSDSTVVEPSDIWSANGIPTLSGDQSFTGTNSFTQDTTIKRIVLAFPTRSIYSLATIDIESDNDINLDADDGVEIIAQNGNITLDTPDAIGAGGLIDIDAGDKIRIMAGAALVLPRDGEIGIIAENDVEIESDTGEVIIAGETATVLKGDPNSNTTSSVTVTDSTIELVIEGSTKDSIETTVTFADPSADRSIVFGNNDLNLTIDGSSTYALRSSYYAYTSVANTFTEEQTFSGGIDLNGSNIIGIDNVAISNSGTIGGNNILTTLTGQPIDDDLTDLADGLLGAAKIDFGTGTDGYVWTSDGAGNAAWEAASGGGGGDMLSTNNLSDVANVATAQQNLDLEPTVDIPSQAQHDNTVSDLNTLESSYEGFAADPSTEGEFDASAWISGLFNSGTTLGVGTLLADDGLVVGQTQTQPVAGQIVTEELLVEGGADFEDDAYFARRVGHYGDTDTHMEFANNQLLLKVGNTNVIELEEVTNNEGTMVINQPGVAIDFRMEADGKTDAVTFVSSGGDDGRFAVNHPTQLGIPVKTDTGDPASGTDGDLLLNSFDNTLKIYEGGAWRTIATW